jgi:hypothetical protein
MRKRGLSHTISAILLILLVVVMAGIIIFWSRGITGEAITINGENIELVCYDISFEFSYYNETLYIINSGNVDLYSMKLVIHNEKDSEVKDIKELSSKWSENGLWQGGVFSDNLNFDANIKEVSLIPVLIGDAGSKKQKEHVCEHEEQIIEVN